MNKSLFKIIFIALLATQVGFFDFGTPEPTPTKVQNNLDNIKRVSRATYLIQHEYYDTNRIQPMKMLQEGLFEMAKEIPELLPKFENDRLFFQIGTKSQVIPLQNIKRLNDLLSPVSQSFEMIKNEYKGDKKLEDVEYAFIGGMLAILDPHSSILPPKAFEEFKTQTQGEYGGLGIVIGLKDDELTVIAPIEDTPAFRAGILADDKILQIGEQSTVNMSLNDAVDMMRGPVGTTVTLRIKSKNTDPREVVLTRELIAIESVQSKLITESNKKIGVLRIKGFQEDTYDDMVRALDKMNAQGSLAGIVIDLRNNPGGLLDQAIMIADKFLESGDIVYTVGADNKDQEVAIAQKQDGDITLPLIVLVNEGSASASEIVSGALKNNNRAIVMGTQSFGKGSVQSLFGLRDGSSIKLTIAQYLTPGRISIQAIGIQPDIHLYPSFVTNEYFDLIEDAHYGEEKLDAHLENKNLPQNAKSYYDGTYLREESGNAESEYVSKIQDNDYLVKLAARLLANAKPGDKADMLNQMKSTLQKEAKTQDDLITQALSKKSINWKSATSNDPLNVEVTYAFVNPQGASISSFKAGEEDVVKVTVKNIGSTPAYRVIGDIDASNPLFNHKELVFGEIEPQQSVTREFKVKVPSEIYDMAEEIVLSLYSGDRTAAPIKKLIPTQVTEQLQPQFAYTYKIHDGDITETSGNKNGIPEKGEHIALEVSIKNTGPGTSTKTVANIKNNEGDFVFLRQARAQIGELKPGQSATAQLKFDVKNTFEKTEFSLGFFAEDDTTRSAISNDLKFDLKSLKPLKFKSGDLISSPSVSTAATVMPTQAVYPLRAVIADSSQLKDVWIYVHDRKVFYLNLENQPVSKKEIALDLPLEDGFNAIRIEARNRNNLTNYKVFSVVYHKDKSQFVTK